MGKLEELRNFIKERFEQADVADQTTIDMLAKIQKGLDDASKEQEEIVAKNAELVSSYKELVRHTSFKDTPNQAVNTDPAGAAPSLEDVLKQFIEK